MYLPQYGNILDSIGTLFCVCWHNIANLFDTLLLDNNKVNLAIVYFGIGEKKPWGRELELNLNMKESLIPTPVCGLWAVSREP